MNKLLPILALLFFFSCDEDLVAPAVGCDNGAEYSEFGYHCGDLSVIQDIIDINEDDASKMIMKAREHWFN